MVDRPLKRPVDTRTDIEKESEIIKIKMLIEIIILDNIEYKKQAGEPLIRKAGKVWFHRNCLLF